MKIKKYGLPAVISLLSFTSSIGQVIEKGGASNAYPSKTKSAGNSVTTGLTAVPVKETGIDYYPYSRLILRAEALKLFAKSNGYDTSYAFLINMGMRSSTKRLFIVNLNNMCIVKSGLVAHGRGNEQFSYTRKYSNTSGSNCTSLGKYKIGKSYKGFFGLSYKMHGLDASNSKAYERNVVMHSMHCIPDNENGRPICQSEGCPAVSDRFILDIKHIVDGREQPVLLWIFDSTQPIINKSSPAKQSKIPAAKTKQKKNKETKKQA